MSETLKVRELIRDQQESLDLCWLAGRGAAERLVGGLWDPLERSSEEGSKEGLVVVVGSFGDDDLAQMCPHYLPKLLREHPAAIILGRCVHPPEGFAGEAETLGVPVLRSKLDKHYLVEELRLYLAHLLAERLTCHGVFLDVHGAGVLLQGKAAVGKSELALELLSRGHRIVADDSILFARTGPHTLSGICPPLLQGFMEVRGLGILNIRRLFGEGSLKRKKNLQLIIALERVNEDDLAGSELFTDRLHGSRSYETLLGVQVPRVVIPVSAGRNLATLVEIAVRQHIQRKWGYNAPEHFIERHSRFLEENMNTDCSGPVTAPPD
jgi:HPr kinase/phosphorylase